MYKRLLPNPFDYKFAIVYRITLLCMLRLSRNETVTHVYLCKVGKGWYYYFKKVLRLYTLGNSSFISSKNSNDHNIAVVTLLHTGHRIFNHGHF